MAESVPSGVRRELGNALERRAEEWGIVKAATTEAALRRKSVTAVQENLIVMESLLEVDACICLLAMVYATKSTGLYCNAMQCNW
jgi:hypothetical protein